MRRMIEALARISAHGAPMGAPMKLRDRAYESFRQHLLALDIRPGQFISQRELVALTGLSLAAIRETIPRLEADGLIVTVPKRGLRIAALDLKLVRNAATAPATSRAAIAANTSECSCNVDISTASDSSDCSSRASRTLMLLTR